MSEFGPAFEFMMNHEDRGRRGTITRDEGGLTKWGISGRAFPDLDVAALTLKDALKIYHDRIWAPGGFERIDFQPVANHVFDRAVSCGTPQAVKLLQTALRSLGADIEVDGVLGEETAAAVNGLPVGLVLQALFHESVMFYGRLAAVNPERLPELLGWLDRATAA